MNWILKQSLEKLHFSWATFTKKVAYFGFCRFFQCSSFYICQEHNDQKNMDIYRSWTFLWSQIFWKLSKQSAIKTQDSTIQKHNSKHTILERICSYPPKIRTVVSAGKHIWNRSRCEEVLLANIEVKIFLKLFMPGTFNNKLWVKLYSQNHTVVCSLQAQHPQSWTHTMSSTSEYLWNQHDGWCKDVFKMCAANQIQAEC